jgi:hypothetical protein
MKWFDKLIIFFAVIILVSIVAFNLVSEQKTINYLNQKNKMCETITTSLREEITSNSTCIDYYCYYAPYAPPDGTLQNKTTTLCVCDCKLRNGTIITVQILSTIPTQSKPFSI